MPEYKRTDNDDVKEKIQDRLGKAPNQELDQVDLIENLSSSHAKEEVLSGVKDLTKSGKISYTRDWKLQLEHE